MEELGQGLCPQKALSRFTSNYGSVVSSLKNLKISQVSTSFAPQGLDGGAQLRLKQGTLRGSCSSAAGVQEFTASTISIYKYNGEAANTSESIPRELALETASLTGHFFASPYTDAHRTG